MCPKNDVQPVYIEEAYDVEYTFCLCDGCKYGFSSWCFQSPCTDFLTSLCVNTLAILDEDVIEDRLDRLPRLETLCVSAEKYELHVEEAKGFLAPEWAGVEIRFEHSPASIVEYVEAFADPAHGGDTVYVLPTATMCINLTQDFYYGDMSDVAGSDHAIFPKTIYIECVDDIEEILSKIPRDLRQVEISLAYNRFGDAFPTGTCRAFYREAAVETALPRVLKAVESYLKKNFPKVKLREEFGRRNPTGVFSLQG